MSSEELAECLLDLCHDDKVKDRMVRITLRNVNRAAYRSIDQGKLNRLGSDALYFKIKPEFVDDQNRVERPTDRLRLHEEFARFMTEEVSHERIPERIKDEVVAYGCQLMKKAVQTRDREAMDASG